eukprot:CAMPEP_0181034758 /NCGR_PEP_ID=MMETSP1070-20121207/7974_2 /TAXON_ID=265543 /ORGANISM="Minutocellus polymorphus, Strain NH13" /LENGTH=65 /DNA_ID=CAMNT_0023112299 /DNA_START=761 /DNA_END=955 /DNA_ORIENTATION=-
MTPSALATLQALFASTGSKPASSSFCLAVASSSIGLPRGRPERLPPWMSDGSDGCNALTPAADRR